LAKDYSNILVKYEYRGGRKNKIILDNIEMEEGEKETDMGKRLFDVIFSFAGLVVLLPLFGVIALLIS